MFIIVDNLRQFASGDALKKEAAFQQWINQHHLPGLVANQYPDSPVFSDQQAAENYVHKRHQALAESSSIQQLEQKTIGLPHPKYVSEIKKLYAERNPTLYKTLMAEHIARLATVRITVNLQENTINYRLYHVGNSLGLCVSEALAKPGEATQVMDCLNALRCRMTNKQPDSQAGAAADSVPKLKC